VERHAAGMLEQGEPLGSKVGCTSSACCSSFGITGLSWHSNPVVYKGLPNT